MYKHQNRMKATRVVVDLPGKPVLKYMYIRPLQRDLKNL